ncbi:MAG: polysaccharide deacetylase family protein [Hydrogenophaga sp.]|uniref:polysaccharide deacetylase family protein n=1 Tax=Hydrogenophaga sp. TaxID=1904254 RepID=UPI00275D4938|nr:polysaccharide deacetylase family protein [Hydrogenophaga sp.]MDP2417125.1 polysaccharide deacetylase family protein [Hydrogenophaga sp.]MDZ4187729.1 polysaccharide deacetylase family protein [Hydrogenophaga sp.]
MKAQLVLIWLTMLFPISSAWAKSASEPPIYFYLSPLTAQYLHAKGSNNNASLTIWRKYLRKACQCFTEVGREELLGTLKPGVLILASTELLDAEERQAIRAFAASGGSLLATWMTGTRGAQGEWVGYDFLDELFKVRVVGEFRRPNNEHWFMIPFGDGPLSWSIPAGRRMYMGETVHNMLRIESPHLAAVNMNWNREKDDEGANGTVAFHESDTHRSAYFSFPEAWGFTSQQGIISILDNTLAWLRRQPKAFKAAWPHGKQAAHLMEMDTEDKFFSAPNFAKDLESIGVRGTFYSLTSEAIKFPEVVKDLLARGHEIAYHADVHIGFAKDAPAKQEARIINMRQQMQTILGENIHLATGFRAPTESYDANTELIMRKHGIEHHAANPSSTEDRLPFFSKVDPSLGPEQALVVLPRTQYDDVNYTGMGFSPEKVLSTLKYDLDLVVMGGAFGLLSVHTQNYINEGLLPKVMPDYVKYVETYKDRLWIPRGDQIATWWRQRERVKVKQLEEGKDIVVKLSVAEPGQVTGLTVMLTNPRKNVRPTVSPRSRSAIGVKVVAVDPFRTALVFDLPKAGEFEYLVRFP